MNTLVLIPRPRRLEYAFFADGREALIESHVAPLAFEADVIVETLRGVGDSCSSAQAGRPDLVVIRAAYGGSVFGPAVRVDSQMLDRFAALAAEAPIHVPPALALARASLLAFKGATVAMAFETGFFIDLPDRERRYGIADDRLRRFGYHGLFHQAASREREGRRAGGPTRTLSLCLEPQPEVAAIIAHSPVMVTSGSTPLEGLPGETACGELDPTIVLTLAKKMEWGPEQINDVLTRRSGLRGLLDKPANLGKLISARSWPAPEAPLPRARDASPAFARNVLAYRILLAAGAGVAAMGGLDRIVITGRYARQGMGLGTWLAGRMGRAGDLAQPPPVIICGEPLTRILADQGAAVACEEGAVALANLF